MSPEQESTSRSLIESQESIEYRGTPKGDTKTKPLRWKSFKKILRKVFGGGNDLVKTTKELAKDRVESETELIKAKAREHTANTEKIASETKLAETERINEELSKIFTDPNLTEPARLLKLSTLFSRYPEIAQQIEIIREKMSKLEEKGASFEFLPDGENPKKTGFPARDSRPEEE